MSLVGKPGYKETAVGWIPVEWSASTLGAEVESIVGGGTPSKDVPEYWVGDIPWASVKDFVGTRLRTTEDRITQKAIKESASNLIPAGTLLTPTRMALGRVAFFDCDVAINQDIKAIFPKPSLRKEFLFYWFQLNAPKIDEAGTGSTVKGIRLEVLREFDLLLPPVAEQQKIAAILTAVDDKLDVIARQISATQTLKQGLMQTLFTRGVGTPDTQGRWHPHTEFQDTELGRIPVGWSVVSVNDLGELKNGINKAKEDFGHGGPFVNLMDVFGRTSIQSADFGLVATSEREREDFSLKAGDFLFIRSSVKPTGVGLAALVETDLAGAVYSGFLIRLRPERQGIARRFLMHFFASDVFRKCLLPKSTISANTNINQGALGSLPVVIPGAKEQQCIAEVLDKLDQKQRALTTKQTHYQSLKRGLMQKLLTGAWRVQVDVE